MGFLPGIVMCTVICWAVLMLLMLPVYFFRKRRNPRDERNTIKSLVITALLASILFIATISAGLIKMYLDQVT